MTEHEMAVELMKWARYHMKKYPFLELFHHVANEGKRNPRIAKSEGMLAGLPDYHLPVATDDGLYSGFWLELKAPSKRPPVKQLRMIELLSDYGNYASWTDNLQDAISTIEWYCKKVTGELFTMRSKEVPNE